MKYKRYLNHKVRVFVEHELFEYRNNKKTLTILQDSMMPSVTPRLSFTGGSGNASSSTESSAIRIATDNRIAHLRKSIEAVNKVYGNAEPIMQDLIKLVYFEAQFNISGAAYHLYMSKSSAYIKVNDFLVALAIEMGLVDV